MRQLYADFLTAAAPLLDDAALTEAAAGYRRAGELWAAIADAALGGGLAPYRALVERCFELLLGRGDDAAEELGALAREAEALTAGLEGSESDRLARLDAVAELAALVVPVERNACAALARTAGSSS